MTEYKVKKVIKRDGRVVSFDKSRIENAIWKAMNSVGTGSKQLAIKLANEVVNILEKEFGEEKIPHVEEIQDIVEKVLVKNGLYEVAKAYILYRQRRSEIREIKKMLGVVDDMKLSVNAITVLKNRYLLKDESGRVIETPKQMLMRVARHIGLVDILYYPEVYDKHGKQPKRQAEEPTYELRNAIINKYDLEMLKRAYNRLGREGKMKVSFNELLKFLDEKWNELYEEVIDTFYQLMVNRYFLPNSPTLMNAGAPLGQLSACFVIPVEDSIESIFDALKYAALIHKSGGGCIAKGTYIYTNKCGVKPIEDIIEPFIPKYLQNISETISIDVSHYDLRVLAYDKITNRTIFGKVNRVWRYHVPLNKLLKIKTSNGFEIIVSEWHPFMVVDKKGDIIEKRADELRVGDLLLIPPKPVNWIFNDYKSIDGYLLSEELAWTIGYILGDGCIEEKRLRAFDSNRAPLENLQRILSEIFNDNVGCIYKEKRYDMWIFQTYNRKVVNFVLKNLKDDNGMWRIPDQIFKSPLNVVLSFIAGFIDAEGEIAKNRARVAIGCTSSRLMQQLSLLLSALGLKVRFRVRPPKRSKEKNNLYIVYIESSPEFEMIFRKIASKMRIKTKATQLIKSIEKVSYKTSIQLSFNVIRGFLEKLGINVSSLHRKPLILNGSKIWIHRWMWGHGISAIKFRILMTKLAEALEQKGYIKDAEKVRTLSYAMLHSVPIKSIMRLQGSKKMIMYDLTVDNVETYLAGINGFMIVHNTGFSFSKLRPRGDVVRTTSGVASGPVSFMRIFDVATDVIKQGGKRRGANMGVLIVNHPDIMDFIYAKSKEGMLTNFNISVAVTDEFMKAVEEEKEIDLINPRTGKPQGKINAKYLFDMIVYNAWRTGDPGLIFIDRINKHNPTPHLGKIESTNPCGEQPLLPYESCNLGSINLSLMVKRRRDGKYEIDWKKLREVVRIAVHFLDNVIDANNYPLSQIEEKTLLTRKIGLGIMGWAELLFKLQIPYDSDEALELAKRIMEYINYYSKIESIELARKRGPFPAFKGSIYDSDDPKFPFEADDERKTYTLDWDKLRARIKKYGIRNATTTTIAPTGTISIIAGTSSGIEPLFALVFFRRVLGGMSLFEINPVFEEIMREKGLYSEKLMHEVAKYGSLKYIENIPEDIKRIFVTALDIDVDWHVKMQAAFQEFTDNAVSKTINLRFEATPEDVKRAFLLAYKLKCKGITVYRYGSKGEQVLYVGKPERKESRGIIELGPEDTGSCPKGVCII